jgi:hypothetical protein
LKVVCEQKTLTEIQSSFKADAQVGIGVGSDGYASFAVDVALELVDVSVVWAVHDFQVDFGVWTTFDDVGRDDY